MNWIRERAGGGHRHLGSLLRVVWILLAALVPAAALAQSVPPTVALVPQLEHAAPVAAIAFSPDGRLVATGSGDDTVKIWDVASGRALRTLAGHRGGVHAVAFSPDGRIIASGSADKTAKLWDAASGRELRSLTGHDEAVRAVAFSPDGRAIATGGADQTLRLWDAASGRALRTLTGHLRAVVFVAFSPDGRAVVSASNDSSLRRWNADTGAELQRILGKFDDVALAPDGRTLAAGAFEPVKLWDLADGSELRLLTGHEKFVNALAFAPDGRTLVSGAGDKTLRLWDLASGRALRTLSGHADGIRAVAFSPDGRTIASASWDRAIKLWDAASGRELRALTAGNLFQATAFSPDGRSLVSASSDGTLRLWEPASGRALRTLRGHGAPVSAVAVFPDGRTIASASDDKTVRLWDAASGRPLRAFNGHNAPVETLAVAPNGRLVASASGSSVIFWDPATARTLRTVAAHRNPGWLTGYTDVGALAFAPDGRSLLSGGHDGAMKLWDAATGRHLRTWNANTIRVSAVAFGPGGRTVVSADGSTVKVWDAAAERELRSRDVAKADVLALSPDGQILATGGGPTLQLLRAGDLDELRTLTGGAVHGVAFAPDARTFVTVGNAVQWHSRDGDLLATSVAGNGDRWLTITPEGFFDASEDGAGLLSAVRGLEAFSIDQFYQALYRPDLVREKLSGDPRGLVREAAAKLDLDRIIASGGAPRVALDAPATAATETVEVSATITDGGGGIGRVEWRVNGVTLGIEARGFDRFGGGAAGIAPGAAPPAAAPVTVRRSLTLAAGENVVEVVAYNAANLIASVPARLTIARAGSAQAAKPRLHVLAVGVNDYRDSRLRLNFATVDARAVGEALRRAGAGLYESIEVTTVLDDGATLAGLDRAFAALAGKVAPDDVFVFFLAGHGKTIEGRYYFIPQDFRYAGDETIVADGIDQDRWQAWFARIPARKSVLLFDTCESGSLTGDRVAMRGIERVAALERMTRATGRTTLTASTDGAPALEGYRGHGVFTYALLDALGRADGDGNGLVDVTELAGFVDRQVPELSFQAFAQRQYPQMKIVGSNFPVAGKLAVLPEGGAPAVAPVPAKPTHMVIAPAEVFPQAGGSGRSTLALPAGTMVTLIRTEQGWALVARDGKPLGFVPRQRLLAAQ